jgi:superfamily II DNA or RNA helicase
VTKGSHFVRFNSINPRVVPLIQHFFTNYIQIGVKPTRFFNKGRWVKKLTEYVSKVFGAATKDKKEYRMLSSQWERFQERLSDANIPPKLYETTEKPLHESEDANLSLRKEWQNKERPEQIPAIDFLCSPDNISFLGAPTGTGKTYMACTALSRLGKRFAVLVRPNYIDKWVIDFYKYFDFTDQDFYVVRGSSSLMTLFEEVKEGKFNKKAILFSNRTIQNYIKLYEDYRNDLLNLGYNCLPEDMYEYLGIGVRVSDEVHQDFHLGFKIDCYTHIEKSIYLSATLVHNDRNIESMQRVMIPSDCRYMGIKQDKYIQAYSVYYAWNDINKLHVDSATTMYSHNEYEMAILKDEERVKAYVKLLIWLVDEGYIQKKKEGQKLVIFASCVEMCTVLANEIAKAYPTLTCKRYCGTEGDSYDNLLYADIRVTTLGSGGTGHDIENLKTTILTVSVDSLQSNIQTLGRLRKLKDDEPLFYYLSCTDFVKPMEYDARKRVVLREKAKSIQTLYCPFILGL